MVFIVNVEIYVTVCNTPHFWGVGEKTNHCTVFITLQTYDMSPNMKCVSLSGSTFVH